MSRRAPLLFALSLLALVLAAAASLPTVRADSVVITVDSDPQGSGLVSVDGAPVQTPQTFDWNPGDNHTLSATPAVIDYYFQSWSDGGARTHSITVPSSPTTYTANYQFTDQPANVTFTTSPTFPADGVYPFVIDGQYYQAPVSFQWGVGSTHTIEFFDPFYPSYPYGPAQLSQGSWSDGGAQTHQITVAGNETITVSYSHVQYILSQGWQPGGVPLQFLNVTCAPQPQNPPFYDNGTVVTCAASAGPGFQFDHWALDGTPIGSANPTTVTMDAPHQLFAYFDVQYIVSSGPSGFRFLTVDGSPVVAPFAPYWVPDSTHTVTALSPVTVDGTTYFFQSWSDGGAQSHNVTVPTYFQWTGANPAPIYLTAAYSANSATQFYLATSTSPQGGGSVAPASGWYANGTQVQAAAVPASGFRLANWTLDGGFAGSSNPITLTMSANHTITANFQQLAGAPCDQHTFTDPITISNATTWTNVCYTFAQPVTVAPSGSLTVINSTLASTVGGFVTALNNEGTLRIDGTHISSVFIIESSSPSSVLTVDRSVLDGDRLDLFGGSATVTDSRIGFVDIGPPANVVLGSDIIDFLQISTPNSLSVSGFQASALLGSYDFAAWGMSQPRITATNTTAGAVWLTLSGGSSTISGSEFYSVYVSGGAAAQFYSSRIALFNVGGSATVTGGNSYLIQVAQAGRLVFTASNTTFLVVASGGSAAISSSGVDELTFMIGSVVEETVVSNFDPVRDGGNFDYRNWNLTWTSVTTTNSHVSRVSFDLETGTLTIRNSIVNYVGIGSRINPAVVRGDIANSTVTTLYVVGYASVRLTNVTDVYETVTDNAVIDKGWYAHVAVYDAQTHQPISGVSLTYADSKGHIASATVDGSTTLVLREYLRTASGADPYYPYNLTASKTFYATGSVAISHFSNPDVAIYMAPYNGSFAFSVSTNPNKVTVSPSTPFLADYCVSGAGTPVPTVTLAANYGWVVIAPEVGTPNFCGVMSVTAPSVTGTYNVVITGNGSDGSVGYGYVTVVVQPPGTFDFSLTTYGPAYAQPGSSGTAYVGVVLQNGPPQTVTLTAGSAPPGITVSFSPASALTTYVSAVTVQVASSVPTGDYQVTVLGTAGGTIKTATLTVQVRTPTQSEFAYSLAVQPSSATVYAGNSTAASAIVTLTGGTAQTVSLSASGVPSGIAVSFTPSSGSPSFLSSVTIAVNSTVPAGRYTFTVAASSGNQLRTAAFALTVVAPAGTPAQPFDYSVTATPISLTASKKSTVTLNFVVNLVSGSAQTVNLTIAGMPANVSASFVPATGMPPYPSILTVRVGANAQPGNYTLLLSASAAGKLKTLNVPLVVTAQVQTFTVAATPTSLAVSPGAAGQSSIVVGLVTGQLSPGTVTLSAIGLPTGVTASFSQVAGTPTFTSTMLLEVAEGTAAGTFTITVMGQAGPLTRTANVTLVVSSVPAANFGLSLPTSTITIQAGTTSQAAVSVNGTSVGQVTLNALGLPSGIQVAFDPESGKVPFSSTITVTVDKAVEPKQYIVTISGASGGTIKTAKLTVAVTATPVNTRLCVVATAAWGSPEATEVAYMRTVRDQMIGSTQTGATLRDFTMNVLYYPWANPLAHWIAPSPELRATFRILLVPLVGIIHATGWTFGALGGGEFASLAAFMVAAILSTLAYIVLPLSAVVYSGRKIAKRVSRSRFSSVSGRIVEAGAGPMRAAGGASPAAPEASPLFVAEASQVD